MKQAINIIFLLLIVLVIGFFVYQYTSISPTKDPKMATSTADVTMQTYTNTSYGYSVNFPSSLQEKIYTTDNVVFGTIQGDTVTGVAEVRVITVEGSSSATFQQSVITQIKNLCDADGPISSFSCTGVDQLLPFTTTSGISGYELYLKGELKNHQTNAVTILNKGPYYIFALKSSATASSALVVHPPLNQIAAEADVSTITAIAKSVQLTTAIDPNIVVNTYISSHLSELSSEKAQLGGTFYVTKIEVQGNSGIVHYEDGHNAYVADFIYTLDTSGKVSVTSFKIRK